MKIKHSMRHNQVFAIIVLILIFSTVNNVIAATKNQKIQTKQKTEKKQNVTIDKKIKKFEYKVVNAHDYVYNEYKDGIFTIVSDLNDLGKDGWELCVYYPETANLELLIFKRPLE